MATRIGQKNGYAIFNNSEVKIGENISLNIFPSDEPSSIIEVRYKDTDKKFSNNLNYFIEGTFTKSKQHSQKINVYLINQESTAKYNIATFNIDTDLSDNTEIKTEPFKIAFRPGKSYDKLVFENIIDSVNTNDKKFILSLTSAMQLRSITSGEKIIQLGIQADPGFIFLMNGEPIKVGKRGFFESPEGYEITDIAVTEPNFIMDYKYETMETMKGV